MLRGMFGLFLRAIVICWMCIVATQFIKAFYDELNKEVEAMNKSINDIYIEIGLEM